MDPTETLKLHDIHLPASPDLWPPAVGWWILLTFFIIASFLLSRITRQRRAQEKQHKVILNKLTSLENVLKNKPSNEALAKINTLLRQLAISHYPRDEIASLTGGDWLYFLDQSGKTQGFSQGAGRILVDAPYRSGELQNLNIEEFIPLIRSWVSKLNKTPGGVR